MRIFGEAIMFSLIIIGILVSYGITVFIIFSNKNKPIIKDLPETKDAGKNNIEVRFVVNKQETVFNYDMVGKKLTVKGDGKYIANDIKAIKAADGTLFFYVKDTGKLYHMKGLNIVDVFNEDCD